jgi:type II secretory pathway pseudopilin PulG
MRNNKGINLIALILVIIVMLIIAGIAINNVPEAYDQALRAKLLTENTEVKKAVTSRYGDFVRNSTANPLIGDTIPSEYTNKEEIKNYLIQLFKSENRALSDDPDTGKTYEEKFDEFLTRNADLMRYTRIIRHSDIVNLDISSISINSVFLVNYFTTDVVGPIN